MTDRELLELAAKAAGLNIEYVPATTRRAIVRAAAEIGKQKE